MDLAKNEQLRALLENGARVTHIEIDEIDRVKMVIHLQLVVNDQRFAGEILEATDEVVVFVKEAAAEGRAFPELFEVVEDYVLDR